MKKLLVLMLVLGMASMASAGLTWSQASVDLTVGGQATVQLVSGGVDQGKAWTAADLSVFKIVSITPLSAAGPDADSYIYTSGSYDGWAWVKLLDLNPPSDVTAGDAFDVVLEGIALGTASMSSDYYAVIGGGPDAAMTVNVVVPEPITMSLLAVGGLFLRRRK